MSCIKKRSKNVSDAEKEILIDLIKPKLAIIENIKVCIVIYIFFLTLFKDLSTNIYLYNNAYSRLLNH